ncbi:glycosyltransferase family 4 protein [bacterium]|nr:glycosyltransferase family 4 protein [bacterium]
MSLAGNRFAFVLPRYFEGIVGGAETLSGELAQQAQKLGAEVEIWTTCARDNRSWENSFPPGTEAVHGITTRRFAVDERDLEQWIPLQIRLSQGVVLSLEEQFLWMEESVTSTGLLEHIRRACAPGKEEVDLVFFAPYLFGTTFWGSLVAPEKSVLIPCLHDEPNAYLEIVASMFRQVRGCLFNAKPEEQLAQRLYGGGLQGTIAGGVVGMGFENLAEGEVPPYLPPRHEDAARFEADQYLLYLGRMETGKNAHLLLDFFVENKERGLLPEELSLVIAGGGSFSDLERPHYEGREDILAVGRVSEEEKRALLRHALVLVQPSTNESFCIVMMEGWREGTPALVHEGCDVTKFHVHSSGGGLYFRDAEDFGGTVRYLMEHPEQAEAFGEAGRAYVAQEYSWEAVRARFSEVVGELLAQEPRSLRLAPRSRREPRKSRWAGSDDLLGGRAR